MHDIVRATNEAVSLADLRRLEKLSWKLRKAEHDIVFLKDCRTFQVAPRFICCQIPNVSAHDTKAIRKRLLRAAIHKRSQEEMKFAKELRQLKEEIRSKLPSTASYLVFTSISRNVKKRLESVTLNHSRKLRSLTKNPQLPFTTQEVVTNLSSRSLGEEELDVLKKNSPLGLLQEKLIKWTFLPVLS